MSFNTKRSGTKSLKFIFLYGMNKIRQMIDVNSLIMFISTTPVTAILVPYFNRLGIIKIINNNLTVCSIILDTT